MEYDLSLAPVVTLSLVENRDQIKRHLTALQGESRRLRFGATVSDEVINRYVNGIKPDDKLYGIFDEKLHLVAFCHVAIFKDEKIKAGEIGISVNEELRNHHVGSRLFSNVIRNLRAYQIKIVYSYCLSENLAMRKLALNEKMCLVTEDGDTEAKITLQDATIIEVMSEPWYETIALVDYNFKKRTVFMEKLIAMLWSPILNVA